jgi:hypothetical protein
MGALVKLCSGRVKDMSRSLAFHVSRGRPWWMRAAVGALERSSHPMGRTAERLSGRYRSRRSPTEGNSCPEPHHDGDGMRAEARRKTGLALAGFPPAFHTCQRMVMRAAACRAGALSRILRSASAGAGRSQKAILRIRIGRAYFRSRMATCAQLHLNRKPVPHGLRTGSRRHRLSADTTLTTRGA